VPPLRVVRPYPLSDGGSLLHLHNVSGGVLAGDLLETDIEVGAGASVQLTTTSATRLYRSPQPERVAVQSTQARIASGGLLEYLPDSLIPFAGSRYRQQNVIELAEDAGVFWWEIVAPGRENSGELFGYDCLELATEIRGGGRPLLLERARLEPGTQPLDNLVKLGQYRYFGSLYICHVGTPLAGWVRLEQELGEKAGELSQPGVASWGVSTLAAHGLVVRALSRTGRDISRHLPTFWQLAKLALYGKPAIMPRKIY
jgi:urease accessory protein